MPSLTCNGGTLLPTACQTLIDCTVELQRSGPTKLSQGTHLQVSQPNTKKVEP